MTVFVQFNSKMTQICPISVVLICKLDKIISSEIFLQKFLPFYNRVKPRLSTENIFYSFLRMWKKKYWK